MARSRTNRVEAFNLNSGPTQSGERPIGHGPVGGEIFGVDKLSVFLSNYWILVALILLVPAALIFYKKRNLALRLLAPLISRL